MANSNAKAAISIRRENLFSMFTFEKKRNVDKKKREETMHLFVWKTMPRSHYVFLLEMLRHRFVYQEVFGGEEKTKVKVIVPHRAISSAQGLEALTLTGCLFHMARGVNLTLRLIPIQVVKQLFFFLSLSLQLPIQSQYTY